VRLKALFEMGALASVPQIIDFASRFGRTIILAHMLPTTEFGVSVAFMVVVTIAQLASDFGVDKFLLTQRDAGDADALAAAHGLIILRGVAVGAVIFAAAPLIIRIFAAPGETAAFRWVALITLLHNFEHLEMVQVRRDFRFRPGAIANLSSQLCAFAAVYPAALLFRDHRAMLVSMAVSAVVYVALSHILAQTRYRVVVTDRRRMREAFSYGLPLTLNGLGIAANSQFDRALVSHWLGLATLALYAVMLNLATVPVAMLLGILGSVGVPFLARARGDAEAENEAYRAAVWLHAVAASAYAVFVAVTLRRLVPFVFGPAFSVSPSAQLFAAMIVWVRLNRGAPNLLLLAAGSTGRLMIANLTAAVGPLLAAVLLPLSPRFNTMLACMLVGEIAALAVLLHNAGREASIRQGAIANEIGWSFIPAAVAAFGMWQASADDPWWQIGVAAAAAAMAATQAAFGIRRYLSAGGILSRLLAPTLGAS
jgi:O-antigen/teichoic acid export membrane protein